jgi:predicted RNA-binding protein with PIN domain
MNYIIDGHNLISKIEGLSLSMPDDEKRLIELLNLFGQQNRGRVEVYFDGAPFGQAGVRNYGRVRAHFVRKRLTADDAIRMRLSDIGQAAMNWVVVSSDHSVQSAAHEVHAKVMSAEEFVSHMQASLLLARPRKPENITEQPTSGALSEAEVKEWLAIFTERDKPK